MTHISLEIFFSNLIQAIHTTENCDPVQIFSDINFDIFGIRPIEGTLIPARFVHLVNGYDAQYYGYVVIFQPEHPLVFGIYPGFLITNRIPSEQLKVPLDEFLSTKSSDSFLVE